MTSLSTHLDNYLAGRRSLGFELSSQERVLRAFSRFAAEAGAEYVTPALFLEWKAAFGQANDNTWANRLGMVRGFATWLSGHEPRTKIPPDGLIRGKWHRARPFIYSGKQIGELVTCAARLPSRYGLRGRTCSTLFGLIAATGLRINEALRLNDSDVDLDAKVITIFRSKNGKARYVPIAASTAERLAAYRVERRRLLGTLDGAFFRNDDGQRLTDCCARYNFAVVSQTMGLRPQQRFCKHGHGPRIHDLRHSFAVHTITDWYRKGLDPDREMIRLTTYLGHSKPEHTYWYIEAVPDLLALASQRAERSLATRDGRKGGAR